MILGQRKNMWKGDYYIDNLLAYVEVTIIHSNIWSLHNYARYINQGAIETSFLSHLIFTFTYWLPFLISLDFFFKHFNLEVRQ